MTRLPATPPNAPDGFVNTRAVRAHYEQLAPSYAQNANPALQQACKDLVQRCLHNARRVLELGAGASPLIEALDAPSRVACDFSVPMLARRSQHTIIRLAADAATLPFSTASFDALFSINLLEHVPTPERIFSEAARVLAPGGRFLVVTPNGDWSRLLEWLETWRLKLPEGPHRFLRFAELAALASPRFRILEHRRFLLLPFGSGRLTQYVEHLLPGTHGYGFLQYLFGELR